MIGENPYYHRGPIKDARFFYDRARETTLALQMVKNRQSVSVIGPRRIGKTSLLLHLSDPRARGKHGSILQESLFVYINGEMLGGFSSQDILRFMLMETITQTGEKEIDISETINYRLFEQTIKKCLKPGYQLTYLIDEFESLSNNPNLDDGFCSFLRSLAVSHSVSYITSSQVSLFSLMNDGRLSNPFFNIFVPLHLGLFSEGDARQVIREPSRAAGLEFSKDTEDFILDLAGPHPFFLQIACFHAFELLSKRSSFDQHVRGWLEESVQADLTSHFEYFAGKLEEEEQRALARLLDIGQSKVSTEVLEALKQKCLIRRCDKGYAFVSRAFAHFVQEEIGTTLAATVEEGGRRMATVLFVDVVGFTPMTEQHLPEEILEILQPVLQMFIDVVGRHRGKVVNFGGDSVMALFGVSTGQSDDAVRAVRAALEIQANVASFAHELKQSKEIDFSVRVGLDTGVVVLGGIGSGQSAEFTAMGDPVQLAQRLEALAKPGTIVISDHTYQQIRGRFRTESLGRVEVKGKRVPVKAYRVLGERTHRH